mgnify:FL=1
MYTPMISTLFANQMTMQPTDIPADATLPAQARALVAGEPNRVANLANIAALVFHALDRVNWVGFYLRDEQRDELVLGPFQGKPACIRIPWARASCGTAPGRTI